MVKEFDAIIVHEPSPITQFYPALLIKKIWKNAGYIQKSAVEEAEEMYDSIMKLTEKDIDASTIVLGENKSIFNEMDMDQKIQEREEIEGSPILSFDDFFSVIEETYRFNELDEQSLIDKIKSRPEKEETPKDPVLADDKDKQAKKIYDDCVKKSLEQGKVLDCVKAGEKEKDLTKKEG
jgi:hypothetical protein